MTTLLHGKIKSSLQAAEGLYHRLVLLVGIAGSGKTAVLRDVAKAIDSPVINLNLALSSELLELTDKQRSLRLPGILEHITNNTQPIVILDNLEILFEQGLKQDPFRLLLGIARNRSVVASWNGSINSGKLIYADIHHPEYRSYDTVEALIVSMDGWATVDLDNKKAEQ